MKACGLGHAPSAELLDILVVAVCFENASVVLVVPAMAVVVVVASLGVLDHPAVRHEVDSTKQSLSRTIIMGNREQWQAVWHFRGDGSTETSRNTSASDRTVRTYVETCIVDWKPRNLNSFTPTDALMIPFVPPKATGGSPRPEACCGVGVLVRVLATLATN